MCLARKLVMSKRDLTIPEKGETEAEQREHYAKAFDEPLTPMQISSLTALAKTGKGCAAAVPASA